MIQLPSCVGDGSEVLHYQKGGTYGLPGGLYRLTFAVIDITNKLVCKQDRRRTHFILFHASVDWNYDTLRTGRKNCESGSVVNLEWSKFL